MVNAGYYKIESISGKKLDLLVINSNLWGEANEAEFENKPDPGGQLEWLQEELTDAQQKEKTVYIIGHIPPGK